jgi:hypothetical protein
MGNHFPVIVRSGVLRNGHRVRYVLNYSGAQQQTQLGREVGKELFTGRAVVPGILLAAQCEARNGQTLLKTPCARL